MAFHCHFNYYIDQLYEYETKTLILICLSLHTVILGFKKIDTEQNNGTDGVEMKK